MAYTQRKDTAFSMHIVTKQLPPSSWPRPFHFAKIFKKISKRKLRWYKTWWWHFQDLTCSKVTAPSACFTFSALPSTPSQRLKRSMKLVTWKVVKNTTLFIFISGDRLLTNEKLFEFSVGYRQDLSDFNITVVCKQGSYWLFTWHVAYTLIMILLLMSNIWLAVFASSFCRSMMFPARTWWYLYHWPGSWWIFISVLAAIMSPASSYW